MESESYRSSKRIVLDSDEEDDEHVATSQPASEGESKPPVDGLGGLFNEDDYEELEDKKESPAKNSSGDDGEEEDAGLFGDDDENEEGQDNRYDYYDQEEQEIEIEQREMDLVIPRYPPSHKPSEDVCNPLFFSKSITRFFIMTRSY